MTQRRSFGFGLLASAVGMLVALGLGCTPSEPTSNETTPKAKTLEPAKPDPQPLYPRSDEPWVWYHALPPGLSGGLMNVGVSNVAYQRFVGARFRDIVEVKDDHLEVRREELTNSDKIARVTWSVRIPQPYLGSTDAVVITEPRSKGGVVGWRMEDGYSMRRFTAQGKLRWAFEIVEFVDPDLKPLGPASLQMAIGGAGVIVYNRGESEAYLDEIDFETGDIVARRSIDRSVLRSGFDWPPPGGVRGQALGVSWPAQEGSYVVRTRGKALEVERAGADGKQLWSTTLDARGGSWWNSAALVEHQGTVVVVAYHGSSSGAVAYGLNRRDGTKRFDASPGSLGPIGHSKYHNDLALTVDPAGHVLTHGNESGGRYVGVLDLAAGRLLGREVWRD